MRDPQNLFGKRLRFARTEAGLSQKQLGLKIGLDETVASARMNQYEVGSHAPKFVTSCKIAEALSIPVPYFYTIEDEFASMILAYGKLNQSDQIQVSNQINQLVNNTSS